MQAGADIVELDVQPGTEVRHARDLHPLPLLFDRGRLRPGWGERLRLAQLLDAADEILPPATRLLVDLKGSRTEVGADVARVLRERGGAGTAGGRGVLVCGRHWPAMEAFADLPHVGILLSAGSAREVDVLRRQVRNGVLVAGRPPVGVSLSRRILTEALVADIAPAVPLVLAWTVNADRDLERVLRAGAAGVITDRVDFLRRLSASGVGAEGARSGAG